MSKANYSREYEQELVERLDELGIEAYQVLQYCLSWLNSDQTCEMLEDYCREYDIPYGEEEE